MIFRHHKILPALSFFIPIVFFSCNQHTDKAEALQKRIDSLETRLANSYKPGFGEFMSSIQAHHSKLWFAGQNNNWKLADFEIHEIKETVEAIEMYEKEREESKMIGMIKPALDSVEHSIQQKNPVHFKDSYIFLTNTCNNCHREANFEFNVVKIPDQSPFSNQDFKARSN
ncbi:MAG TPA: hypothetical protein PKC72_10440 [Chitinophagaceae bacterium]|nr:hypothetical protein [Chitinophagaceae bacterium]